MATGTSLTSSRDALRLSRLYPGVLYATAGQINNLSIKQNIIYNHIFIIKIFSLTKIHQVKYIF